MNYIIKHTGSKPANLEKVIEVISAHQGSFIDDSNLPAMALVEIGPDQIEGLKHELDVEEWQIFPEKSYQVPSTRKKTGRSPFDKF